MKQYRQSRIGIGSLVASVIALAATGALAADGGNVGSTDRSVNEVQGRASASPLNRGVRPVTTGGMPAVSEIYGRGSHMARASATTVGVGPLDAGSLGRGSSAMATASATAKPGPQDAAVALAR